MGPSTKYMAISWDMRVGTLMVVGVTNGFWDNVQTNPYIYIYTYIHVYLYINKPKAITNYITISV